MFSAADFASLYADCGTVEAAHTPAGGGTATPVRVQFAAPGDVVLGGDALCVDYSVRYRVTSLPSVRRGDTFVIAGTTYRAREDAQPLLDGTEARVLLERP
jgi:hypothetical protein